MSNCWSCGRSLPGGFDYAFTCPDCVQIKELKNIRESNISGFQELARIQEDGFEQLGERLAEISSVIEWGFEEISWRLHEQTTVLKSIDHTLKTPRQTEAKELREMAEQLRNREELIKSEEFFLQSLELNPLDYRTYIGLSFTYMKLGKFDNAESLLETSLRHAPKDSLEEKPVEGEHIIVLESELKQYYRAYSPPPKPFGVGRGILDEGTYEGEAEPQFDYRSYSYRLLGRIHYCKEEYQKALESLRNSIQFSPEYYKGNYDLAQYSALFKYKEECISALKKAILGRPFYFYLAQKEKNFEPLRNDVEALQVSIKTEAVNRAEESIAQTEHLLKNVKQEVSIVLELLEKSREKKTLESKEKLIEAWTKNRFAEQTMQSGDYNAIVEAVPISLQSRELALEARRKANSEQHYYESRCDERAKELTRTLSRYPFYGAFIGAFIGSFVGFFLSAIIAGEGADFEQSGSVIGPTMAVCTVLGAIGGITIGIIISIHHSNKYR